MKRTVILLAILTLLVITVLCRWDIRVYDDGVAHFITNKVSIQTRLMVLTPKKESKYFNTILGNEFLFYGTTAFLYAAIAATTIALLLEARKHDP